MTDLTAGLDPILGDEEAALRHAGEHAAAMHAARAAEVDAERARVRGRLERDLRWTMERLAEPLDRSWGETPDDRIEALTSSRELEPGVHLDVQRGVWVAWDYDPVATDGEVLEAVAETLSLRQAAAMLGMSFSRVRALAVGGQLARPAGGGVTVASVLALRNVRNGRRDLTGPEELRIAAGDLGLAREVAARAAMSREGAYEELRWALRALSDLDEQLVHEPGDTDPQWRRRNGLVVTVLAAAGVLGLDHGWISDVLAAAEPASA